VMKLENFIDLQTEKQNKLMSRFSPVSVSSTAHWPAPEL